MGESITDVTQTPLWSIDTQKVLENVFILFNRFETVLETWITFWIPIFTLNQFW